MTVIFPALVIIAMVLALIDIITRDQSQMNHLPKFGWIILVILLPLIGTVLWYVLGRDWSTSGGGIRMPEPRREAAAPPQLSDRRTTEEQLADLDREIEYYRRRAELDKLRGEAEPEAPA